VERRRDIQKPSKAIRVRFHGKPLKQGRSVAMLQFTGRWANDITGYHEGEIGGYCIEIL